MNGYHLNRPFKRIEKKEETPEPVFFFLPVCRDRRRSFFSFKIVEFHVSDFAFLKKEIFFLFGDDDDG